MEWTWDPNKNRENIDNHEIDFPTALLVFNDQYYETREDDYPFEQRWQTIGTVSGTLIVVVYTRSTVEGEPGRIITAREATKTEKRRYQEGIWSD